MNVLRDGRSERGTARGGKRHDLKTVRWYVLTLPTTGAARRDWISPAKSLDAELSRRERRGETLIEYFAPSYVEVRKVDGKLVNTRRPLLFNYVFIRSSVEAIFRMKQKEGQKYEKTEIRLCLDDPAAVYYYACFCCVTIELFGRLKLCTAEGRTWC